MPKRVIYDLEVEGYRCECGHSMGAHKVGGMDYSEVVESSAELPCVMPDCDCGDYAPATREMSHSRIANPRADTEAEPE